MVMRQHVGGKILSEEKMKHLEFVLGVINRMANNSFLLKGWCITLVAAIFVLSAKDANCMFMVIAFISIMAFWILDSFYLYQERLYRFLYDEVATKSENIDFSMKTERYMKSGQFISAMFSKTLIIFYVPILFGVCAITWFIYKG